MKRKKKVNISILSFNLFLDSHDSTSFRYIIGNFDGIFKKNFSFFSGKVWRGEGGQTP